MISIKKLLGLEYYTSRTDEFLAEYDQKHTKQSHSQHKEREKYRRIYKLRDNPAPEVKSESFWDKF